jgi:hypothetical protein
VSDRDRPTRAAGSGGLHHAGVGRIAEVRTDKRRAEVSGSRTSDVRGAADLAEAARADVPDGTDLSQRADVRRAAGLDPPDASRMHTTDMQTSDMRPADMHAADAAHVHASNVPDAADMPHAADVADAADVSDASDVSNRPDVPDPSDASDAAETLGLNCLHGAKQHAQNHDGTPSLTT